MNRREFSVEVALSLLGGAAVVISGCGGGSGGSLTASTPSTPPMTDRLGDISANHSHIALVTAAQQGEGGSLDLDIRGTSGHTHMVSLTSEDMATIRRGGRLAKESSGSSHTHTVTFNA